MLAEINITDDDIAFAERLLLRRGKTFDDERRTFIRRLDTLDLQAVPGSGKTTALLAKLAILERYLPIADGSGILVVSHTNAAVTEIEKKIGTHCPRLFSYPNYVGTIQMFVNRFLAIPYYVSRRNKRPTRIDNEIYEESMSRFSKISLKGFSTEEQRRGKYYLRSSNNLLTYRLSLVNKHVNLTTGVNGSELFVTKPRGNTRPENYHDWSALEKGRVVSWLKELKFRILKDGVLCFDDAYFLASYYLSQIPKVKTLIQSRFRFAFVDEMQDMGKHQFALLEELFYDHGDSCCGYQRIGDRNQAIHGERDFEVESAWQDRTPVLTLSNSYRLSVSNARVVTCFALQRESKFKINGLGESDIKPHIIVYDDDSRVKVIQRFSSLLHDLIFKGQIPIGDENVFTAVAWNSTWVDEESKIDPAKVRLIDYCSLFQRGRLRQSVDHDCLEDYLQYFDKGLETLGSVRSRLLSSILKTLRLEDVRNPTDQTRKDAGDTTHELRYFTANTLLTYLREGHADFYEDLRLHLYRWSIAIVRGQTASVVIEIRALIRDLLHIFGRTTDQSSAFVDQLPKERLVEDGADRPFDNKVNFDGFDINLATVHSIKGQTHSATIYMETYFQKDGNGPNAKSYESQRLAGQFLTNALTGKEGKRVKQSAKMVYVGFSRPTHLLCFAVHQKRFEQYLACIDHDMWQVIRLDEENAKSSRA